MSCRRPRVTLVAAIADNGVIGRDNALPWRLPEDLRRFKALTLGHTLLMGRLTYESIGRPLPGRRTLVLTSDPSWLARQNLDAEAVGSADTVATLATAATIQQVLELAANDPELFVVGGARVYESTLPIADRLSLTRVHAAPQGDTSFPPIDLSAWKLTCQEHHESDDSHAFAFTFECYERIRPANDSSCSV